MKGPQCASLRRMLLDNHSEHISLPFTRAGSEAQVHMLGAQQTHRELQGTS